MYSSGNAHFARLPRLLLVPIVFVSSGIAHTGPRSVMGGHCQSLAPSVEATVSSHTKMRVDSTLKGASNYDFAFSTKKSNI